MQRWCHRPARISKLSLSRKRNCARLFQILLGGNAMKLPRRTFLHLAASAAALPAFSRIARAQAYPARPVRMVVNLAPGGGLDFMARVIGESLSRSMGQQIVIENKPGAGGMLGVETVAKSPPDGYTLLATTDVVASAPYIMSFNVDYVKDLAPVIELVHFPVVLAAHPSLGVKSVAELVRVAKQRPTIGYATSGAGTQQHFVGEWFAQLAGIKLEHVPYRGAGQAINDLIAGHVPLAILGPVALIPHYNAGNLRLLAQSTKTRSPSLPQVPTFEEAGVNGLALDVWQGILAPPKTPASIIGRLNAEMDKALTDPVVRARFLETAQEPVGGSAEKFSTLIRDDSEKYARLAKELKIKG
jgi:tripartite-type tricarboxylate transporter receptor subunit TctC